MTARTTLSGLRGLSTALARAAEGPLVAEAKRTAARRVLELARRQLRSIGGRDAERVADALTVAEHADGTLDVGSSDPAGAALEHGELDHRPSPWLQPAFEQCLPEARQQLRQALLQELKNTTTQVLR